MLRVAFIFAFLMALPTAIYVVWLLLLSPRAREGRALPIDWGIVPWQWLVPIGAVCAVVGLGLLIGFERSGKDAVYERPKIIDGKVVPGRMRPRKGGGPP